MARPSQAKENLIKAASDLIRERDTTRTGMNQLWGQAKAQS